MAPWKHHGWMQGGQALIHGHLIHSGLAAFVISLAASWTLSLPIKTVLCSTAM